MPAAAASTTPVAIHTGRRVAARGMSGGTPAAIAVRTRFLQPSGARWTGSSARSASSLVVSLIAPTLSLEAALQYRQRSLHPRLKRVGLCLELHGHLIEGHAQLVPNQHGQPRVARQCVQALREVGELPLPLELPVGPIAWILERHHR